MCCHKWQLASVIMATFYTMQSGFQHAKTNSACQQNLHISLSTSGHAKTTYGSHTFLCTISQAHLSAWTLSQHFVNTRWRAQQRSVRTKYPSANTHLRDKRLSQACQCGKPKSCGTVAALENYRPTSESVKCVLAGQVIEETFKTIFFFLPFLTKSAMMWMVSLNRRWWYRTVLEIQLWITFLKPSIFKPHLTTNQFANHPPPRWINFNVHLGSPSCDSIWLGKTVRHGSLPLAFSYNEKSWHSRRRTWHASNRFWFVEV